MIATFQQKLGTTKVKQKFCLSQIIKEPTLNEMSSCIDLCFTTQPKLVTESGVICSLHSYCCHNLKLNLKIYYLPTYECRLWYYQKANSHHISHAIVKFSWESICKSKCKWNGPCIQLKILKISFRTSFLVRLLSLTTTIHLVSTAKWKV